MWKNITFHSMDPEHSFSAWEFSMGFFPKLILDKSMCFSLNKTHKPQKDIVIYVFKKKKKSTHGCLKQFFKRFLTKMPYFTSQEVGNPVQIMLNYEGFNPFYKTQSLFTWKLFKVVYWWYFYKFRHVTKWGCYSFFKLLIMLEYRLLLCDLGWKWCT